MGSCECLCCGRLFLGDGVGKRFYVEQPASAAKNGILANSGIWTYLCNRCLKHSTKLYGRNNFRLVPKPCGTSML